jgi:hypothetical protein
VRNPVFLNRVSELRAAHTTRSAKNNRGEGVAFFDGVEYYIYNPSGDFNKIFAKPPIIK